MKRFLTGCALILLAACAAGPRVIDSSVTHIPREDLLSPATDVPATGYLSTSQPNEQVLDRVAAAGYTTVIDFRGVDENRGIDEKAEVEARGMRYVSLPIATTKEATYENAQKLVDILGETEGPVLMHCFSGNRAGAMLALAAKLEGATDAEALSYGKRGGLTSWEEDVTAILETAER